MQCVYHPSKWWGMTGAGSSETVCITCDTVVLLKGLQGVGTACEGFGHLRYDAGILSKNGGHHAIPHRKQPLEMIFSNFFQKSIFPLHT